MGFEESSGFCWGCNRQVLTRRRAVNHCLHIALLILSAGLWAPVWLFRLLQRRPWRCTRCGGILTDNRRASMVPVFAAIALDFVFLLLLMSLVVRGALREESRAVDRTDRAPPAATTEALSATVGVWTPKREAAPAAPAEGSSELGSAAVMQAAERVESAPGATGPRITLREPHISIQTAVTRICESAGLRYNWRRSYEGTNPRCRGYISVQLSDTPLEEALDEVVVKNGLRYRLKDGEVWLEL